MVKSPARKSGLNLDLGTQSFKGLGMHVSMLWLILLFVLITVAVCTYGGLHQGLGARQFPDTTVNGDLTVDGAFNTRGPAVGVGNLPLQTAIGATAATATLVANAINPSLWAGGAAVVYTLPAAVQGRVCVYLQAGDTGAAANTLTFNCAGSDAWETGSIAPIGGATVTYDTSTAGETNMVYTSVNDATQSLWLGSKINFVCYRTGRWAIEVVGVAETVPTTGAFAFAA